jgi:hypothetical protein
MGAARPEKYEIQEMSLDAIRSDPDVQSRAATSMEYMRDFSEAMLRGEVFPPVILFFDGKIHWLADGFHRYGAAKHAAFLSIRAEVRYGTRRDAMIFSAGANWRFSIPRKPEDIQRAADLLFSDGEWGLRSTSEIAAHLHSSHSTVRRHRLAYHERTGTAMPKEAITAEGKRVPMFRHEGIIVRWDKDALQYAATVRRRTYLLGLNRRLAVKNLAEILALVRNKSTAPSRYTLHTMDDWLGGRGVHAELTPLRVGSRRCPDSVRGLVASGITISLTEPGFRPGAVFEALGKAILLRTFLREQALASVVLCEDVPDAVAELAMECGVRILTPEAFVIEIESRRAKH